MRISHAITALGSVLTLLAAVGIASAQSGRASLGAGGGAAGGEYDPSGGYPSPAGPGYVPDWNGPYGVPGAGFQPAGSPMPPAALYPPGGPTTMNPWPEISPFYPPNVSYTQHKQSRGLWFREQVFRNREYDFAIEYLQTSFKKPRDTLIGSAHQPVGFSQDTQFGLVGPVVQTYGLGVPQPLNTIRGFPGAYPFPFLRTSATAWTAQEIGYAFPIHNLGALYGDATSDGVKLRYGFTNEDGTGWNATGFWANDGELGFQRGTDNVNGMPISQTLLTLNPLLIATFYGGLPLIFTDDPFDPTTFPGYLGLTQKFDVMYRLEYDTKAAGAELNRFLGYWYKGNSTRISTFIGARYLYLNEHFGFHGIDSGFGYDFDVPDPGDTPAAGDFHPTGTLTFDYPLLHARLNSDVQSHLAGPQVGFRIDLGERSGFHVWTQSTFGILANHERLEITGNNIGVPIGIAHPEMHDGVQFLDNSFRDYESHTHASPLFEQSIIADVPLAGLLPFLKKSYFLENAQFRAGYTFTWVGEVSRPGDSIAWRGFPQFPSVRIERHSFWMNQLNLGLNFAY